MSTSIYAAQATIWLQSLKDTPCFAGVHYEVPATDNPGASECTSGTYARSPLTWEFAAARTLTNLQLLQWLNLVDTTIIGIGVWDAPQGGQLRIFYQLWEPVPITGRGSWSLDPSQLYVQI